MERKFSQKIPQLALTVIVAQKDKIFMPFYVLCACSGILSTRKEMEIAEIAIVSSAFRFCTSFFFMLPRVAEMKGNEIE